MSTTTSPTRRRLRAVAALAAISAASTLAAAPAHGAGTTSAFCTERFSATITPGFSTRPGSGTVTTGGQTGTIVCVGSLDGHRVTGPGSIGFDETYTHGSCRSDMSTGTVRVTVPTTGGTRNLVGTLTQRRTALAFHVDVRFPGARYSGLGVVIPTQGNCLITPLQKVTIVLTGSLAGA